MVLLQHGSNIRREENEALPFWVAHLTLNLINYEPLIQISWLAVLLIAAVQPYAMLRL